MVNRSIVSIFDRLSVQTVLTGQGGSLFGFFGTLAFIAVCLIILIPPIYLYNNGSYFESQFISDQYPKNVYTTGKDLILAISFRNKKTNEYANHTEIKQNLISHAMLTSQIAKHKIELDDCKKQVFKNAINPITVKDCLMIPSNLVYDIQGINGYFPYISMSFLVRCQDPFQCSTNSPFYAQKTKFMIQLNKNYYYEYIFSSRIIDDKGYPSFQFHKIYSSQYSSPDTNSQFLVVKNSQKQTFVDNSIMPWWNNNTYTGIFWSGKIQGKDITDGEVVSNGFFVDFFVEIQYRFSYRYYKKLDYILGMIGGAIFLLYIIFWIPFSYINRTLQKIKYAEELFIDTEQQVQNIDHFKKVNISLTFLLNNLLPFQNKQKDLVNQSQNQVSIVNLIKKIKVSYRNLKVNKCVLDFKPKDIDFSSEQKQQENSTSTSQQNALALMPQTYEVLRQAPNGQKIFTTQPTFLALKQSPMLPAAVEDDKLQKIRPHLINQTFQQKILHFFSQIIKFFDVFGARPMFNAEPYSSSCWGFCLAIIIVILSFLTVALTMYNMDTVKIVTTLKYESPENHYYEMITGKSIRFAFCIAQQAIASSFTGPSRVAQLSFFKHSKKNGYQEIANQRMVKGQFFDYFQLQANDPYGQAKSQDCFRAIKGVKVPFGGSYGTNNQAYFGVRIDPYCIGTPQQCLQRKNQTITNFLNMINVNSFGVYLNENKYSPTLNRLIPGVTGQSLTQTTTIMNNSLKRTQTIYVSSIQLIEDKSKTFLREQPKLINKTVAMYQTTGDNNEQRKGDPYSEPAYILEFRPNGQVKQVILRTYKIDFLLGIIGGTFLFWYFVINLLAKVYNSFKFRAKMAEILYQEDSYNSSILVCFLHLIKIPSKILCCSELKEDVIRMKAVDEKIQRDLDLVNLVKKTENCYYLSSSLFHTIEERNLSLIYFRQKIDQSQTVKSRKPIQQERQSIQELDQYGSLDDDIENTGINRTKNQIVNQNQENQKNNTFKDLQKIVPFQSSSQTEPLFDSNLNIKKENAFLRITKNLDLFKNPPQLTLDGQRDVKSIIGGTCFFIDLILIVIVVAHFLGLYLSGADFTLSHRRFRDEDLSEVDTTNTLGQLNSGISLESGKNFKFAIAFHKKDHYFPFDVSSTVGGPVGVRMLQYTVKTIEGGHNETYEQIQFQPCRRDYAWDFLDNYNDRDIFGDMTYAYCLPDGKSLTLRGIPEDFQKKYFKLNVYNRFMNTTGKDALNNFFRVYVPQFYMSIPRLDFSRQNFNYQMTSFGFTTDIRAQAIENNLTMTKIKFTDKYYDRSRQTYSNKISQTKGRFDIDTMATQYTRNVTFYYTGMIDQYTLDYPGGGQLFGLVGGVIGLFTFIMYSFVMSFNQYRMKYMIGQRLYSLDKKTSIIYKDLSAVKKGNSKKTNKQKLQKMRQKIKKINNFNELELLLAWILSPLGYIKDNYNYSQTLRCVTLIVQKVEQDINLYNYYQKLQTVNDTLNSRIKLQSSNVDQNVDKIKLTSVYFKKLYQKQRIQRTVPSLSYLSRKHKLSSFQQINIQKALIAKVNPEQVLGDKVLNNIFGLGDNTSILQSRFQRQSHERNSEREQPNSNTLLAPDNQSYANLQNQFSNATIIQRKQTTKKIQQDRQLQIISQFDIQ